MHELYNGCHTCEYGEIRCGCGVYMTCNKKIIYIDNIVRLYQTAMPSVSLVLYFHTILCNEELKEHEQEYINACFSKLLGYPSQLVNQNIWVFVDGVVEHKNEISELLVSESL